jgi:hypothetical protein
LSIMVQMLNELHFRGIMCGWESEGSTAISDISIPVKDFVRKNIDSVHQLELLLLLKRYEDRAWTASELARELYTSPTSVEENLRRFVGQRLVSNHSETGKDTRYRYQNTDQDGCIQELVEAYKHFRVRIIDTIFSKSSDSLRDFSNAFKLKRDEDES